MKFLPINSLESYAFLTWNAGLALFTFAFLERFFDGRDDDWFVGCGILSLVAFALFGLLRWLCISEEREKAADAIETHWVNVPFRHTLRVLDFQSADGATEPLEVSWTITDGEETSTATISADTLAKASFSGPGTLRIKKSSTGRYPAISYRLDPVI